MLREILYLPSECLLFSAKACPHEGSSSLMQETSCTFQGALVGPGTLPGFSSGENGTEWVSLPLPEVVGVREEKVWRKKKTGGDTAKRLSLKLE